MDGGSIISRAKKKYGLSTDRAVADHFGTTIQTIRKWKKRKTITERQLLRLIDSAVKSASSRTKETAIRPIMEFMRIEKSHSRHKKRFEILTVAGGKAKEHAYRRGLRTELERLKGVYVFFDSRGQAIYVGKAQKQSLWKELNLAFNRDRGEVQKIKRVKHPTSNVTFESGRERKR